MATIVIDLPDDLKPFKEKILAMLSVTQATIVAARSGTRSVDYAEVERRFAEHAAAIERAAHEVALQALDIDAPALLIAGKRFTRVLRTRGTFKAMAGEVGVEHSRYRADDERNGRTVDAITLRTGAIGDGWLPATSAAMAHAVQQSTSREAAAHAATTFRLPYSRSAFEDVAHLVGQQLMQWRSEVEDDLVRCFDVPAEARSISVSLDRVTIPMEEPRPKPVGRPKAGAPKNPICRVFRMGYVGTVSLHDENGEALHTIRYGRMPEGDVAGLMAALEADTKALLAKRPDLRLAYLADGAPELWDLLEDWIDEEELGAEPLKLLDFWHVAEKLAAALRVIGDEASLARWKFLLLNRVDAVGTILDELHASGKRETRVGKSRPVHEAITYLENNRDLMSYTTARRRGLPIGSGIAEATCKSLFDVRMKRAGSRWKTASGDHVLHLRALALSDRWDDGVQLTLGHLRKPVRRVAA